jgi:outer membrane protein assembly factor BamB
MTVDQLIFVGFNGYAVALNRETGEIVWSNNKLQSGHVTFLLDEDRLIVSTNGYIFCLNPLTGEILWQNPMKGYGYGVASLASVRGSSLQVVVQQAAQEEESSHTADTSTTSG